LTYDTGNYAAAMARADTLPETAMDFCPVPSTTNPLGAKGAGEGGTFANTPTHARTHLARHPLCSCAVCLRCQPALQAITMGQESSVP
jgi:hypothetical protein